MMMNKRTSMKSQTSFQNIKRIPSMAPSPPAKNSQMVEFASSPQPPAGSGAVGEEITHHTHSKHPLTEVRATELFTCGGCKEYGAGKRYACQQCEFQLHEFCTFAPPFLNNHPLHAQHQLVLHAKPKQGGGLTWPRCDVCGKTAKGFAFRCRACSFQMHPCCALLSTEINFPGLHHHPLRLLPPSTANGAAANCGACNKKRSGRMYRCKICEFHIHAVCAKAHVNGLQENGITPPENPSGLGVAARLASRVVIQFVGSLFEGFGEGMAEALVQNIGRGRCMSRRRDYN